MIPVKVGPSLFVLVLALAAVAARPSCAPDDRDVHRIAPRLDPEMARHLVSDDDTEFKRYCRGVGTLEIKGAMTLFEESVDHRSEEDFARTWAAAAPFIKRLVAALDSEFYCPDYLRRFRVRERLPVAQQREIALLLVERDSIARPAVRLSREARADHYRRIASRLTALGDAREGIFTDAFVCGGLESKEAIKDVTLSTAARLRAIGDTYLTCQVLGDLGALYLGLSQPDSTRACYDEALRIAFRCRFPDQASRLLFHYARLHIRQGRIAVAMDLVREALRVCREFGGGATELHWIGRAMVILAELECWDAVEQMLDRSAVLLAELERTTPEAEMWGWRVSVQRFRAHVRMARGDPEGADRLFRETEHAHAVHGAGNYQHMIQEEWSASLLEAGLPDRALQILERGMAPAESLGVEPSPALLLRHAEALVALGRHAEARRSIARMDSVRPAWVRFAEMGLLRDIAAARIEAAIGDPARAREAIRQGLVSMRRFARTRDASSESQLALASLDEMRLAAHEILAPDPASGYRFEMAWRGMTGEAGRGIDRAERDRGDDLTGSGLRLPPPGVVHLVYLPLRETTVRWTATSSGVARDTLPLSREQARDGVREVLDLVRRDGADAGTGKLARSLRDLAGLLLPSEVLRPGPGDAILCVSADGPLAALPFEALEVARDGEYQPLALHWDVARLRSLAARRSGRATGQPSIVADPALSASMRRRFAIAAGLDQAVAEARLAATLWPDARQLMGAEAQKPAVLEAWRMAPRILIAAHLVRTPDLPFQGFIPLATTRNETVELLEERYTGTPADPNDRLDPCDVRALDLSGCDLVVLSACASGAADLSAKRVAPSFGDAFLDAGARATVQTLWPVEDDKARAFVTAFLRASADGLDPVRALGETRRAMLADAEGRRQPSVWAAWSVGIVGFPQPRPAKPRA